MDSKFGRSSLLLLVLAFLCVAGYTREYRQLFRSVSEIHDIDQVYESTVWVHYVVGNDTFIGTGWVVGYDKDLSLAYISTAGHVIQGTGYINILYWPKQGDWLTSPGFLLHQTSIVEGDIAIIAAPIKLNALPMAARREYEIGDEVLVAGVQHNAPPALVALGYIKKITEDKIFVDGWSWRGHSGGPIIHRKTNRVIGFVVAYGTNDLKHAGYTQCSNFKIVANALQAIGIQ